MKRVLVIVAGLAVTAVGTALAYQAAARDRDYRVLLARGDTALRDDQTFGALEAYSGAIALRPDSMLAHLRRGETYQRRGDLDRAVLDFRTAAASDPGAIRPLDELGDVFYQRQRFKNAADTYADCLRVDDRSPNITYKLALARYREGDVDAALTAVRQAVRLNDRMPEAHYLLAMCLRERGQMPAARSARTDVLSPGMIPREELADLYAAVGRHADELEQLRCSPRSIATTRSARWRSGWRARAGHDDLAVLTLGSALERTPDQPLIYGALGESGSTSRGAIRSGRCAQQSARRARTRRIGAARRAACSSYGRALAQAGDGAAERTLRQATERYPVEPMAFLLYATAAERQNHLGSAAGARRLRRAGPRRSGVRAARLAHRDAFAAPNDVGTAISGFRKPPRPRPTTSAARVARRRADQCGDYAAAKLTVAKGLEKDPQNAALPHSRAACDNQSSPSPSP